MIRILIADDHAIVRQGLRQILHLEPEMELVAEATNGNQVLDLLKKQNIDIVILDLTMEGRNGLETLNEIRRQYPRVNVIVLSMHRSDQYAVRALKAGAVAYISKDSATDDLVEAIRRASRGEKYINPEVAQLFAEYVIRGTDEPHRQLSDREFEVFRMIAMGKGLTEISRELNLSVKTISTYKTRILEKTGLASNSDITRYVVDHGLM